MDNVQADQPKGDILIIDDTISNLQVLSEMLDKHGYEARGVPDGPTALIIAGEQTPDLILLDIKMPDMDGYEVCQRLKADDKTRDVPIIFISALDEITDKVKGFEVGGVDYITKPFQVEDVLARVETHLTLRNLQKQLQIANAKLSRFNQELENTVRERTTQLQEAYDMTISGWASMLELRDQETIGHSQRVTEMTVHLARKMGIEDEELIHIRRGALLHDIGKMGIADSILLKPGPLTEAEQAVVRQHSLYAYERLKDIPFLQPALAIPRYHHEKWDGRGYNEGLKGEQIPLAARIFAVVDVWDALSYDRPYRNAWPKEKVRAYISEQSGKHFDPAVVEMFLQLPAECFS